MMIISVIFTDYLLKTAAYATNILYIKTSIRVRLFLCSFLGGGGIERNNRACKVSYAPKIFMKKLVTNCHYRTIKQETKGDTIYIYSFKTTLFNNKAENYQKTMNSLEFKEINKIIFVDDNEKETVLWSK